MKERLDNKLIGFPTIYSVIESNKGVEILMKANGHNLKKIITDLPRNKQLSKMTVLKITVQLIERLKVVHDLGFIHGDIKSANILVGLEDPTVIYLIDFGVSHAWRMSNGTHIKKYKESCFIGNSRNASFNNCRQIVQSRRDDI